MIAICVLSGIAGWLFLGGVIGQSVYKYRQRNCRTDMWEGEIRVFTGLFWPLALPFLAGTLVANCAVNGEQRRTKRESKASIAHKRALELKAADARNLELSLQVMRQEGVNA